MLLFLFPLILSIFFALLTIYFLFKAFIHASTKENKNNILASICSILLSLVTAFNIKVPPPTIYPLDNEIRKYYNNAEVVIEAQDFFDIYYSLDGSDPKKGYKYNNSFIILDSTTVSAKNKFLFWWSDVSKNTYIFDNKEQTENKQISFHKEIEETEEGEEDPTDEQILEISPVSKKLKNDEVGTPFVISTPLQDTVTNAYLTRWDEKNDRDIIGNTYSSAMKLTVYNLINTIGGGSSNIIADVHIPFGQKFNSTLILSIVVAKDMVGNGSSADVTIYSGDEEIISTFTLDSTTTDEIVYEIDLTGVRDLIISFDCHTVGNGFCVGIVLEDK